MEVLAEAKRTASAVVFRRIFWQTMNPSSTALEEEMALGDLKRELISLLKSVDNRKRLAGIYEKPYAMEDEAKNKKVRRRMCYRWENSFKPISSGFRMTGKPMISSLKCPVLRTCWKSVAPMMLSSIPFEL